jgi:hypothetical protein
MKISFGIIVVNGMPWIRLVLESLYKHAHSICIAEGATVNWRDTNGFTTPRSTDGTLDAIRNFPDPEHKIKISSPDRFYSEKLEQCNEWMKLVPEDTDYVWEVDVDEFYHDADINKMKLLLHEHNLTYVEFPVFNFFKGLDYYGTGGRGWGYGAPFPRIFKYYPGCMWSNHRPPTICDRDGTDFKNIRPLQAHNNPVRMFHYSYVTDKQVREKINYYSKTFGRDYYNQWYLPFYRQWTYDNRKELEVKYSAHPSCPGAVTKRYDGCHPDIIVKNFKVRNNDVILRVDDFPTGIRPVLKDISPIIRILGMISHYFGRVSLGIVPKLFNMELYDMIRHMDIEPCMHGYDHKYFKYSKMLADAGDLYNVRTVADQFNEFQEDGEDVIFGKIMEGKKILEDLYRRKITSYIPPCNKLDEPTKRALKACGFTTVFSERKYNDGMFEYITSDFYGKVLELNDKTSYSVVTLHLTWEYDDLTWKGNKLEEWIAKLHKLRGFDENLV